MYLRELSIAVSRNRRCQSCALQRGQWGGLVVASDWRWGSRIRDGDVGLYLHIYAKIFKSGGLKAGSVHGTRFEYWRRSMMRSTILPGET